MRDLQKDSFRAVYGDISREDTIIGNSTFRAEELLRLSKDLLHISKSSCLMMGHPMKSVVEVIKGIEEAENSLQAALEKLDVLVGNEMIRLSSGAPQPPV